MADVVQSSLKRSLHNKGPDTLDSLISSSCQRYLTQRVDFQPSTSKDPYLDNLRERYQPLNSRVKMDTSPDSPDNSSRSSSNTSLDGLPKPHKVLFDPAHVKLEWTRSISVGAGLCNMGNTCFLNSVIQCLSYTPPLVNYLQSQEHKAACNISGFCAMCELDNHITRIFARSTSIVKPIPIVQNLKAVAKHFRFGRQEDAHEFLRYFIDSLQKSCLSIHSSKLDPYSKATTVIHQIFGGYHRSQVRCLQCDHTSNTYDPLLDISLDIKGCSSVTRALQNYIQPDLLDNDNKYICPRCKKLTRAEKRFTIHRAPPVLTIQLKRFNFDSLFGSKINKDVSYEEHLNIRPYMSDSKGGAIWYKLYGVLVHYGYSCHSGHYLCYVRNSNGSWYCLNDSSVSQANLKSVLSQEAYLLFYIRDDKYKAQGTAGGLASESRHKNPFFLSTSKFGEKLERDKLGVPLVQRSKPTGVVTPSPKATPTPSTPSSSFVSPQPQTETYLARKNNTPATIPAHADHTPSSHGNQQTPITKQEHLTKPGFVPRSVLNREKKYPALTKTSSDTSVSVAKEHSFPSLSEPRESEGSATKLVDETTRIPPHVSTLPRIPKKVAKVRPMPPVAKVSPSCRETPATSQASTQGMTHRTRPAPYNTGDTSRSHVEVKRWDTPVARQQDRHQERRQESKPALDMFSDSPQVSTWAGQPSSLTTPTNREESPNSAKKRGRTQWDLELDKGKTKKTREEREFSKFSSSRNDFQDYHNRYNRSSGHKHHRHHHHYGYRHH